MRKFFVPVLVVIAVGLAFFSGTLWQKVKNLKKGISQGSGVTNPTPSQPVVTLDNIKETFDKAAIKFKGENEKLIFIEISDPSCPYCNIAAGKNSKLNREASSPQYDFRLAADGGTYVAPIPEIKKLVETGQASYAIIYYPGHGNGELAMKALYCAFDTGKYWPVHDLLMTAAGYDLINNTVQNDKAKTDLLVNFLKPAVDSKTLQSCLDSGKYEARLTEDRELASSLGTRGTPNFYVNATNFPGAASFKSMEAVVTSALK